MMSNRGKLYAVEGDKLVRKNIFCPRCKAGESGTNGVFMARHADRNSCGRCGYTVWDEGSGPSAAGNEETPPPESDTADTEADDPDE